MPENRGNATVATTARGHRPLPTRDTGSGQAIRPAHQPQEQKPSTFNWDWNKATCTGCQTKVLKTTLVDDQCPTCRGVEPVPESFSRELRAPDLRKREHSKSGDQVYEHLDDAAVRTRFEPAAPLPDVDHQSPVGGHAPVNAGPTADGSERDAVVALPPAGPVSRRPLNDVDLLEESVQHAERTLRAAHGIEDPIVGILRTNVLSAIAALDFYVAIHCTTTDPRGTAVPPSDGAASLPTSAHELGGGQPAADPRGEARPRPERAPAVVRGVRRPAVDVDESAVVLEYAAGDTSPAIARRHGVLPKRIRQILQAHGVQLRDDRATHSGSKPHQHDQATIDALVRRYVHDDHTIEQIATDTGMGRRQVASLLRGAGVTLRLPVNLAAKQLDDAAQADAIAMYLTGSSLMVVGREFGVRPATVRELVTAAGHVIRVKGNSAGNAQRLRDLAITAAQVKDWAMDTGLVDIRPAGLVGGALIDAYQAAHPTTETDTQTGGTAA